MDDNDGQMIFGDLVGLKLPDILLTGKEKPQKTSSRKFVPTRNRTQTRTCYRLLHSGGQQKGWRMSCDVGEVTERLENEQSSLCFLCSYSAFAICIVNETKWKRRAGSICQSHQPNCCTRNVQTEF